MESPRISGPHHTMQMTKAGLMPEARNPRGECGMTNKSIHLRVGDRVRLRSRTRAATTCGDPQLARHTHQVPGMWPHRDAVQVRPGQRHQGGAGRACRGWERPKRCLVSASSGFPMGKSTLFNALVRGNAQVANYPFTTIDPNRGIVDVPDPILPQIGALAGASGSPQRPSSSWI